MVGEMVKFDLKHCSQSLYFKPWKAFVLLFTDAHLSVLPTVNSTDTHVSWKSFCETSLDTTWCNQLLPSNETSHFSSCDMGWSQLPKVTTDSDEILSVSWTDPDICLNWVRKKAMMARWYVTVILGWGVQSNWQHGKMRTMVYWCNLILLDIIVLFWIPVPNVK